MKRILTVLSLSLLTIGAQAQTISGVSPNQAEKGTWSLPVTITGNGTSFSNATSTVVRIKQGSEQLNVLNINSVTPTSVSLDLQISNYKPIGSYSVEVFDQNLGLINLSNGFMVLPNSNLPVVNYTTPESGALNQVLPVTMSLSNTHFAQATDNTIYLTQGTSTIMPIPGSVVVLNDNYIKALFDLDNPLISIGSVLNSHCGNSFDGYFTDNLSISITQLTTISGIVIYGGIYNGVVELYQKNTNVNPASYSLVATVAVDGSNNYSFNGVADADYLLRSVPIGMNDVVATYFPNAIDWTSATEVDSDPILSTGMDITPFNSIDLNGNGTVNGSIGYGPNGFTKASFVMAEGIEVFLKNTATSSYAQASTDVNGLYSFSNVPNGIYQIVINLPGYTQVSSYDFVLNGTDNSFSGLDFLIDESQIFKSGFLGMTRKDLNVLTAFPNPTNGELFIQIPSHMSNFDVVVYNQFGQNVWQRVVTNNSTMNYFANISNLANGIYYVSIQNESKTYQVKVVKQ